MMDDLLNKIFAVFTMYKAGQETEGLDEDIEGLEQSSCPACGGPLDDLDLSPDLRCPTCRQAHL